MWPIALVVVYSLLIMGASLLGGWLPSLLRLTHTRMQLTMSFVGGLMLGVAVLHLLPHAAVAAGSLNTAVISTLAGLVFMFLLIRLFHVHAHGPAEVEVAAHEHGGQSHPDAAHADCDHDHDRHHSHVTLLETDHLESDATLFDTVECHRHPFSWIGLTIGLSLHTLIDGMAVAASVAVEAEHAAAGTLVGLGTFLAVLLHKPLDALSITSVMAASGWTGRWKWLVNFLFALTCPLGVLVFYFGLKGNDSEGTGLGIALGFAAGAFLCIALSDLLPEVQFHSHDRLKLSVALLAGVLLAYAIGFLEPEHQHRLPTDSHDHHGHQHHGHQHHGHQHHGHDH